MSPLEFMQRLAALSPPFVCCGYERYQLRHDWVEWVKPQSSPWSVLEHVLQEHMLLISVDTFG